MLGRLVAECRDLGCDIEMRIGRRLENRMSDSDVFLIRAGKTMLLVRATWLSVVYRHIKLVALKEH